jgi:hypothetical protein
MKWRRFIAAAKVAGVVQIALWAGGCVAPMYPSRTFTSTVRAGSDIPEMVVLTEVLRVTITPDAGDDSWKERLTQADVRLAPGSGFVRRAPALWGGAFGWTSWQPHYRWTLFAPGYEILTVYPDYGTIAQLSISPVNHLKPGSGPRISPPHRPFEREVSLELPLHPLTTPASDATKDSQAPQTVADTTTSQSPMDTLSWTPVFTNVATFNLQLASLRRALKRIGASKVDPRSRAVLWESLDKQRQAFTAVGRGKDLSGSDLEWLRAALMGD